MYYMIVNDLKEGHSKNSIRLKYNVGYGTIQRISEEINESKSN